jgi:hypothetical protein
MIEQTKRRRQERIRVWLALSTLTVLLALVIVPPYISVNRYRNRIMQALSASLGTPVRLSSVELRILPRPSFVLTDLVVAEDAAYGAEPVLHANTVTAAIRLASLWRGKLQINRISVDEASLNLVRSGSGRWNLDPFFRTATLPGSSSGKGAAMPFPYLEATNSRINIKNGVEKLPYSLVNADLSFWQESPGEWRIRLRGQPARTDVSLDLGDTGIVRLEASFRRAPQLRQMPIHLDMDWKAAQLGQLSRLLIGSDEGWRGDLTGEVHLDGTAESAQIKTRLQASGVHRAEFAPPSPMDFDASCGFVYHYSTRGLENVLCDSPIGEGRARLTGNVPGQDTPPELSLELDRVPVQVALDALRTVRRGIDPSLQAGGIMSGRIIYSPVAAAGAPLPKRIAKSNGRLPKSHPPVPEPLSGSVTAISLRLSGDHLAKPIQVPKVVIEPAPGEPPALAATFAIPAGGPTPLTLTCRLALTNYQLSVRGGAALPRLRDLANAAGLPSTGLLDRLEGQPAIIDLSADGPWLPAPPAPATVAETEPTPESAAAAPGLVPVGADSLSGTITLHAAAWKPDFLANPVQITTATLHLDGAGSRWDPVAFSYGPVAGSASLTHPRGCDAPATCGPKFALRFGLLDAAALQAAILGAHQQGTLLSSLLSRIRPSTAPAWPEIEGTIQADALVLGPVTLDSASASLRIRDTHTEIESLNASLMGGKIHATGSMTPGEKPGYKLEGRFEKVSAAELGQLLGMTWTGDALDGTGEVELSGFTDQDLAASARGSVHFDWRHGAITDAGDAEPPPALARFDRWTADATIGSGGITLTQNQVQRAGRKSAVAASAAFGDPPRVSFDGAQDARAAKQ